MAQSIQHDPAALILELSAASTPNIHSPIASPGSQLHDAIVSIPLAQNIRQVSDERNLGIQCLTWRSGRDVATVLGGETLLAVMRIGRDRRFIRLPTARL